MDVQNMILDIDQRIEISADPDRVFEAMLNRLGEGNVTPEGNVMPMKIERFPGGRWFRDLGKESGHLWGFVQVIKPPKLLEICGPMFMSYPACGHLQLRVTPSAENADVTVLSLRHRALGMIEKEHAEGAKEGWSFYLDRIKKDCV